MRRIVIASFVLIVIVGYVSAWIAVAAGHYENAIGTAVASSGLLIVLTHLIERTRDV